MSRNGGLYSNVQIHVQVNCHVNVDFAWCASGPIAPNLGGGRAFT